ncbi:hypothetical protein [Pseudarthrobacter niigatensis]|uniref:Uncharacterized protein n=1 Tax=Pseudarthrobacter niigatensis TaxID=369935 RepID=A0AAJ1SUM8_9MICC|nr:hypothetical protein [Pseudarthrobacter niigatensis]MDQ0147607.1 hypothetical protein [Pseudarthrobacter niigatensis]MDQ0267612.1 hypothetical protein [Pseudarthrobacter niigatensis]
MNATGDQTTLHPYWDVWQIVQGALDASKPAAAATAFHCAVSLMPTEIPAAEKNPALMPESFRELRKLEVSDYDRAKGVTSYFAYPLTDQGALAYAAALGDIGSLAILDSFCGRFGSEEPKPCSDDYLRIVAKVREIVAAKELTDIKDVRKVFSAEDRVRLRSVWRAMRDAGQLIVETKGTKILFHRTAPEPAPSPAKPVPFRKGMKVAEARLLELPPRWGSVDAGRPADGESPLDGWTTATPAGTPLAKALQRTRTAEPLSAGANTWLQTGFGKRADGSRYFPTEVIGPDGSVLDAVDLEPGRFRSDPQGDCVVSVDSDVIARIYSLDARLVAAFDMGSSPEVLDVMRKFGDRSLQPSSAVRSVHASIAQGLLVVSVIDHVFVYKFDGEVVAALRLNEAVREHLYEGVSVGSSSRPDWAYFVQLAAGGDDVFIGAYSGLLLKMKFNGDLTRSWNMDQAPMLLRETPGGIAGLVGMRFFQANGGEPVEYKQAEFNQIPEVIGKHVLLKTRKTCAVFDLESFQGWKVDLPEARRAAYLVNGGLVMETTKSRYSF